MQPFRHQGNAMVCPQLLALSLGHAMVCPQIHAHLFYILCFYSQFGVPIEVELPESEEGKKKSLVHSQI